MTLREISEDAYKDWLRATGVNNGEYGLIPNDSIIDLYNAIYKMSGLLEGFGYRDAKEDMSIILAMVLIRGIAANIPGFIEDENGGEND